MYSYQNQLAVLQLMRKGLEIFLLLHFTARNVK